MSSQRKVRVGIIGCGNILPAYINGTRKFEILELAGCADLNHQKAQEQAKEYGCTAYTVPDLIASREVDLVINLTSPAAHAEITLAALNAGKHVHSEKPLAITLADGQRILDTAKTKGLLVGCAPDTFLGAGLQTCRKLIDDGWLGTIVSGSACMLSRGPEAWHPNPAFFYAPGAGPMFDMGPYYLTALVHLLGPVREVSAVTSKAFPERLATCKERFGELLPVQVPTHYSGTLVFHSGAVITVMISFDVHSHRHAPMELYGTHGSLSVPDPNTFGGPVEITTPIGTAGWNPQVFSHPYPENSRSIGAADLAYAILGKRSHRCTGALAYHVLEVMHAFETSSVSGSSVVIASRPERPSALPLGLVEGRLDP